MFHTLHFYFYVQAWSWVRSTYADWTHTGYVRDANINSLSLFSPYFTLLPLFSCFTRYYFFFYLFSTSLSCSLLCSNHPYLLALSLSLTLSLSIYLHLCRSLILSLPISIPISASTSTSVAEKQLLKSISQDLSIFFTQVRYVHFSIVQYHYGFVLCRIISSPFSFILSLPFYLSLPSVGSPPSPFFSPILFSSPLSCSLLL